MGTCLSTKASGEDLKVKPITKSEEFRPATQNVDGESQDGVSLVSSHISTEDGPQSNLVNGHAAARVDHSKSLNSNEEKRPESHLDSSASHHSVGSSNSVSSGRHPHPDGSTAEMSVGDSSSIGSGAGSRSREGKKLSHSSSIIGLDSMIENRREEGGLRTNVVHMEVPFGKPIEEVYDGVHTGPVLGHGISGLVRLVTHKATGVKYAVKCLDLSLVDTDDGLHQLREEIFIMCQLDHPNIVRLEEVYESHSEIYLVQELCLGGELFDRLDEQPDYHYTEAECARLVKQMLCAVRYLHSKGIIHRDLKLENFLFSSTAPDSELKMIDFGLSKHFRYGEVQHEAVGTPYTVAPEVIRGTYDERCDIWAIGVISFLLLSGDPPFGGCGGPEPLLTVRSNILKGEYRFEPEDIWSLVSLKAKQFIQALLVTDPKDRPTARGAQKHGWLLEWANKTRTQDDNVLNPNVVKALVTFKEFSDMRKLLCEVLSFTLLPDQIKDLRKEFEKMDTDGSGEISLSALKQVLVTNAGAGSLGALTEEEVEDIFNAMRVKKTETRIVWHEFIAAGLSQCQVDDRNLRLAFDRLDNDHKGYVTLDDIMDLVGNDALHSEEAMRKMWVDSMEAVNCNQTRITYDDFLLLMKGQTKENNSDSDLGASLGGLNSSQTMSLIPLTEEGSCDKSPSSGVEEKTDDNPSLRNGEDVNPTPVDTTPARRVSNHENPVTIPVIPLSPMPLTPIMSASVDDFEQGTPLSMDEDDDLISPMAHPVSPAVPMFDPAAVHQQTDGLSPVNENAVKTSSSHKETTRPQLGNTSLQVPSLSVSCPQVVYVRKRSRSMDDEDKNVEINESETEETRSSLTQKNIAELIRSVSPIDQDQEPGHRNFSGLVATDANMNAKPTNRQLFLAHRSMRHSVMEASKRFEENRARHARDFLIAQNEAEGEGTAIIQAGLVMRRGQSKQVSSEQVKKLLERNESQQQKLFEKANRRCGRGRRSRKKTISDMSGMIVSMTQEPDMGAPATEQAATTETMEPLSEVVIPEPTEPNLRGATVPGEFRKVQDPFGANGKYGSHFM